MSIPCARTAIDKEDIATKEVIRVGLVGEADVSGKRAQETYRLFMRVWIRGTNLLQGQNQVRVHCISARYLCWAGCVTDTPD